MLSAYVDTWISCIYGYVDLWVGATDLEKDRSFFLVFLSCSLPQGCAPLNTPSFLPDVLDFSKCGILLQQYSPQTGLSAL